MNTLAQVFSVHKLLGDHWLNCECYLWVNVALKYERGMKTTQPTPEQSKWTHKNSECLKTLAGNATLSRLRDTEKQLMGGVSFSIQRLWKGNFYNSRPDQSMKLIIDNNRWQSITINRLISEIDDQSMAKKFVFLKCDRLLSIVTNCDRLSSISIFFGRSKRICFHRRNMVEWNYITIIINNF